MLQVVEPDQVTREVLCIPGLSLVLPPHVLARRLEMLARLVTGHLHAVTAVVP